MPVAQPLSLVLAGHYALAVNENAVAVHHYNLAATEGIRLGPLAAVHAATAELGTEDSGALSWAINTLEQHQLHGANPDAGLPCHERYALALHHLGDWLMRLMMGGVPQMVIFATESCMGVD